jgi:hypothetical protein
LVDALRHAESLVVIGALLLNSLAWRTGGPGGNVDGDLMCLNAVLEKARYGVETLGVIYCPPPFGMTEEA